FSDSLVDVLVPSYEIERRTPFFFKSERAKANDDSEHDFPMWQVARATTAAPTFFEPAKVQTNERSEYYSLVDAGIFVNNPAMCALAEARSTDSRADVLVASLGTGELSQPILHQNASNWGLRQWAQPLFGISFDGTSATVDYQLKHLLATGRYYRFQTKLNEANDDMDDASPTNLRALQLLAEEMIGENTHAITELCDQLT
ncbi:MAG: patatin-like phospholipase family protein, partial [Dehalococcoidia bacterium]